MSLDATSQVRVRTNSKSNNEQSDREQCDFLRDIELFLDSHNIGRDDRRSESDDKTSESNNHRDVPFVRFGPILWVLGIVGQESDELVFALAIWSADTGIDLS